MMKGSVRVSTPDHVDLEFDLAGVGSRFAAFQIDLFIIGFSLILLWITALLVFGSALTMGGTALVSWSVAFLILAAFLLMWGYFVFFEALWRGRTPGKRLMGLCVLRDDGLPIGLREAALRNLVRAADLLPPPAGLVGGFVILLSRQGKRLGDMAAGTMVVHERSSSGDRTVTGALWMERVEKGAPRHALTLPGGKLDVRQLTLVERFLQRRHKLPGSRRAAVAWKLSEPLFPLLGEDIESWRHHPDRFEKAEEMLDLVASLAQPTDGRSTKTLLFTTKEKQWKEFDERLRFLGRGKRALRQLTPDSMAELIDDYRRLTADLARARSLGADSLTVDQINQLAVEGHSLLNGYAPIREEGQGESNWFSAFARAVRRHRLALLMAAAFFFLPASVGYLAVQWYPQLGYELVPESFLEFSPARSETLHDIPALSRPVVASSILSNNLQVALLAFGYGLTAGIGTGLLLIYNGVYIGAIAGWLTHSGQQRALWGWIMPHGGTELLAIVIAGSAGFILAEAILAPGRLSRREALKRNAIDALVIELGCLAMLLVAGIIEGFVSPSSIGYPGRIAILTLSLLFWFAYLAGAGRFNR